MTPGMMVTIKAMLHLSLWPSIHHYQRTNTILLPYNTTPSTTTTTTTTTTSPLPPQRISYCIYMQLDNKVYLILSYLILSYSEPR